MGAPIHLRDLSVKELFQSDAVIRRGVGTPFCVGHCCSILGARQGHFRASQSHLRCHPRYEPSTR